MDVQQRFSITEEIFQSKADKPSMNGKMNVVG